jgi:DNA-binding transcriptional LysR family regulator
VARHLSYTRAAEELHLTQPAVFTQVKQLEESLGQPLLERLGKQLFLTDAGRETLATAHETLNALERLEMRLADLQGLKRGRLRLAIVTTAESLIPRLLGAFCQQYPGIDATLTVANRETLLARLADNIDDLVVLGAPPEHIDVVATAFADNPLVVVARHDHPLANSRAIALTRIAEESLILREAGSGTRLAAERLFAEHGLEPRVRLELGSNEAVKQAVAGGLGLTLLSAHTLALEGESGLLRVLDVEGLPLLRQWYVAYQRGKHLSVVAEAFLDFLLAGQRR